MISAFDRTLKLGLLLSVLDWLTFNVVFLIVHHFEFLPFKNLGGDSLMHVLIANIAYIIALQFVSISLHDRQSQPARVLSNTSRTSVMFIMIYTSL